MSPTIRELQDLFDTQCSLFDRKFEIVEGKLDGLNLKLDTLMNNHLSHIKDQVTQNTNDLDWVKKIQWASLGASMGALVTIVTALITNSI